MNNISFVSLNDIYLIKDKNGVFELCINSEKYFSRLNRFTIEEGKDYSCIKLSGIEVGRLSTYSLQDFLFGTSLLYSDTSLADCNIEAEVLYNWQCMIADKNIQKKLDTIFSRTSSDEENEILKTQIRTGFFKNLLRGYSAFTKETFKDSQSTDVYHYYDKELDI